MSDEQPSAVEAVQKAEAKSPTFGEKLAAFLLANWRPLVMTLIIIGGYVVKKTGHYTEDEEQLFEGIWLALGLGAVFTPSFKRTPKDPQ